MSSANVGGGWPSRLFKKLDWISVFLQHQWTPIELVHPDSSSEYLKRSSKGAVRASEAHEDVERRCILSLIRGHCIGCSTD